jgi:hypothetical protein
MTYTEIKTQEKKESNDGTMRLHVAELGHLFNTLDPSRFQERDLDSDAEQFVTAWARDLPPRVKLALEVEVDHPPSQSDPNYVVTESVRSHFSRKAETTNRELRALLRRGRTSLIIGLLFLAICIVTAEFAANVIRVVSVGEIIRQGLTIAGWVAMWRPMEIFLYDWWPLVADRRLYRRLANMPVQVLSQPRPSFPGDSTLQSTVATH